MSDSNSIISTNDVDTSEIIMYIVVFIFFVSTILFFTHPNLPDTWGLVIVSFTQLLILLTLISCCVIAPLLYFYSNKKKNWIYDYWISHYDPKIPFSTRKNLLIDSYKCRFKKEPNKKILRDLEGFDKYLERVKKHMTTNQYCVSDIIEIYNISCDHPDKQNGLSLNILQGSHLFLQYLPNKLIEINSIIDLNDPIKQFEDGFFETYKVSTLTRLSCFLGFIIISTFLIFGTLGTYFGYFDSSIQNLELWIRIFIIPFGLLSLLFFSGLIFLMTITALGWYHGRSLKERKQYLQYYFLGHINHSSYSPSILVLSLVAYLYLTLIAGINGYKTEFFIAKWVGLKNTSNPNKKRRGRPLGDTDANPYYTLIWHNELAKKKEFQHNSSGNPYLKKIVKEIINRYQRNFGIKLTEGTIKNYYKIVGLKKGN